MSRARFQTLNLGDFAVGRRGEIRQHRLGASRQNSLENFLMGTWKWNIVAV
jgi:hypothetical protein